MDAGVCDHQSSSTTASTARATIRPWKGRSPKAKSQNQESALLSTADPPFSSIFNTAFSSSLNHEFDSVDNGTFQPEMDCSSLFAESDDEDDVEQERQNEETEVDIDVVTLEKRPGTMSNANSSSVTANKWYCINEASASSSATNFRHCRLNSDKNKDSRKGCCPTSVIVKAEINHDSGAESSTSSRNHGSSYDEPQRKRVFVGEQEVKQDRLPKSEPREFSSSINESGSSSASLQISFSSIEQALQNDDDDDIENEDSDDENDKDWLPRQKVSKSNTNRKRKRNLNSGSDSDIDIMSSNISNTPEVESSSSVHQSSVSGSSNGSFVQTEVSNTDAVSAHLPEFLSEPGPSRIRHVFDDGPTAPDLQLDWTSSSEDEVDHSDDRDSGIEVVGEQLSRSVMWML